MGNVTVAPRLTVLDNFRAIQHPSQADMRRYLLNGARALWPQLETIKHTSMIEHELRDCSARWSHAKTARPDPRPSPSRASSLSLGHYDCDRPAPAPDITPRSASPTMPSPPPHAAKEVKGSEEDASATPMRRRAKRPSEVHPPPGHLNLR